MAKTVCRICWDSEVRMHQIPGSEVQDVYEKLTSKKVKGKEQYCACYICYSYLKNCQDLVTKSQRSEELVAQVMKNSSEFNPKSITPIDRQTYGLVNSLMPSETESDQFMEKNKHTKEVNDLDRSIKSEKENSDEIMDRLDESNMDIGVIKTEYSESDLEVSNDRIDASDIIENMKMEDENYGSDDDSK